MDSVSKKEASHLRVAQNSSSAGRLCSFYADRAKLTCIHFVDQIDWASCAQDPGPLLDIAAGHRSCGTPGAENTIFDRGDKVGCEAHPSQPLVTLHLYHRRGAHWRLASMTDLKGIKQLPCEQITAVDCNRAPAANRGRC